MQIHGERILIIWNMLKEIHIKSVKIKKSQAKSEQVLPSGLL